MKTALIVTLAISGCGSLLLFAFLRWLGPGEPDKVPRKPGKPRADEWVRLLVALGERGIEVGAIGRLKMVCRHEDEIEYWIQFEGHDGYAALYENELWQLELVEKIGDRWECVQCATER